MRSLPVILAALFAGGCFRIKTTGAPLSPSVRLGGTIATLIVRLEPYVPSLDRNHGKDRYGTGLLIHSAVEPSFRRFVPIATGQAAQNLGLARFTAVEGSQIFFRAPEDGAYDVKLGKLLPEGVQPKRMNSAADVPSGEQAVLLMLTAGGSVSPTSWLGAVSDAEAARDYRPGFKPTTGYQLQRSKEPRRLVVAAMEDGRIRQLTPLPGDGMLSAGFARATPSGEILSLSGGGFLLLYETKPYRAGAVVAARVDGTGKVVWRTDTGIGELREVLPDPDYPALIGDRPKVPDKLSEPILVVVNAKTGQLVTHSLWLQ
jgi:hypothetical protein